MLEQMARTRLEMAAFTRRVPASSGAESSPPAPLGDKRDTLEDRGHARAPGHPWGTARGRGPGGHRATTALPNQPGAAAGVPGLDPALGLQRMERSRCGNHTGGSSSFPFSLFPFPFLLLSPFPFSLSLFLFPFSSPFPLPFSFPFCFSLSPLLFPSLSLHTGLSFMG